MLLDVGTRPDAYALQKLYNFMRATPQAGGVCGEIEVEIQPGGSLTSQIVQMAQFYEYKLSHSPDKACESFFGFTSVLPGAYSMFRWNAIKGSPLDTFFKHVSRDELPSCAEANEYLAEDRIMCLQVYIKEKTGYSVQYIPDAKAFTDAPQTMTVLMKQRRRWMNGALFGTYKVIANWLNMVSCRRNNHPWPKQVLMVTFMIYLTTLYLLQFLTISAMFLAIMVTFDQFFEMLISANPVFKDYLEDGLVKKLIFTGYLLMLLMTVLVSSLMPIERSMRYFRVVSAILGVLIIAAMLGLGFLLASRGLYPNVRVCVDQDSIEARCIWEDVPGETYLSLMCPAGAIMLGMYVLPFFMRPLDFLQNFKNYTLGFFAYMMMLPVFTNVFQIYAMCNLHDVSWGNRPSSTGQETFTEIKNSAIRAEADYKVYRTNFLMLWLASNAAYYVAMSEVISFEQSKKRIDSDSGYLAWFSLYLAGLTLYRIFFSICFILKWKLRYCCSARFRVQRRNIEAGNLEEKVATCASPSVSMVSACMSHK